MRTVVLMSKFKRDYKVAKKRSKNLKKLEDIIEELRTGKTLPAKNENHKLKGVYAGCWECHIEPDWLLVYEIYPKELVLVRMGTHSDLF
jgi:mRNA interferase YafQ